MKLTGRNKNLMITIVVMYMITFIVMPVMAFVLKHYDKSISEDPADWALFGDYIGGVLNTVISFCSLIILSFITWDIAKNNSEQDKIIKEYDRKSDAYDHLMKSKEAFHTIYEKEEQEIYDLKGQSFSNIVEGKGFSTFDKEGFLSSLLNLQKSIMSFYSVVGNFRPRFGHVFDYDFDNNYYNDSIRSLQGAMESVMIEIDTIKKNNRLPEINTLNRLQTAIDCVDSIAYELRKELVKKP